MEMLRGDVVGWGEMLHWKGKSNQREREQGLGLSGGHSCGPWKEQRCLSCWGLIEVFWFK